MCQCRVSQFVVLVAKPPCGVHCRTVLGIGAIEAILGFRVKRFGRVLDPLAVGSADLGAPFSGVASHRLLVRIVA